MIEQGIALGHALRRLLDSGHAYFSRSCDVPNLVCVANEGGYLFSKLVSQGILLTLRDCIYMNNEPGR